jgi:Ni/Co efflux regulator RcnB
MRTTIAALLLGSTLALPVAAHAQNFQQLLGGLLTGNQQQDQSLQDAWRRGYQRGRQDQAREDRTGRNSYDRGADYRDDRGYPQDRPYASPPDDRYRYPPPR